MGRNTAYDSPGYGHDYLAGHRALAIHVRGHDLDNHRLLRLAYSAFFDFEDFVRVDRDDLGRRRPPPEPEACRNHSTASSVRRQWPR